MVTIRVDPQRLADVGSQLLQQAKDLSSLTRPSASIGGLDWEVRARSRMEDEAQQADDRLQQLAGQLEVLGRYLQQKAQDFAQADQQPLNVSVAGVEVPWYGTSGGGGGGTWSVSWHDLIEAAGIPPLIDLHEFTEIVKDMVDEEEDVALGSMVGGIGLATFLSIVEEGAFSPEEIRDIAVHESFEAMIEIAPPVKAAMVANKLVQLSGKYVAIGGLTELGKAIANPAYDRLLEQNAQQAQAALERMDISRVTRAFTDDLVKAGSIVFSAFTGERSLGEAIITAAHVDIATDTFNAAVDVAKGGIEFVDATSDQVSLFEKAAVDRAFSLACSKTVEALWPALSHN